MFIGMVTGIVFAVLSFACVYSKSVRLVTVTNTNQSSAVRTFAERRLLDEHCRQVRRTRVTILIESM